jgi:putative membrane protein
MMSVAPADLPYCGAPATPLDLWARWTLEPGLLAGLAILGLLATVRPSERGSALAGWSLLLIAFASPLCALSMALFSARIGQHLLLTLIAAPLLVQGFGLSRWRLPPLSAAAVFGALFWLWHAPAPYAATLGSDLIYWTMHLSLLGAACALWAALLGAPLAGLGKAAFAAVATGAQMSLLAVILLVSAEPWHAWHIAGARPWGLTALADQQIAAGLMWVCGALAMGVIAASTAGLWMRRVEAETAPALDT